MVLVVNSGSSSIKFRLYKVVQGHLEIIAEGIAERIGLDGSLTIKANGIKDTWQHDFPNHLRAVETIIASLQNLQLINKPTDIEGIGFRVVHGTNKITKPIIIDQETKMIIKEAAKLAPLHNPGALIAIEAFEKVIPQATLVAQFDTAFHQTIPEVNFIYPVPYEWYQNHQVRKYGFHGISYQFITQKMAEITGKASHKLNLIVCHLGNGASVAAIKKGVSFDTTMGFTPLAGLMMGTRSGNIDPSILAYMGKELNLNLDEVTDLLNKKSGLLGLSQFSSDMRDIENEWKKGTKLPSLAYEKYVQIAADFIVTMANRIGEPIDALVFTAGIGENSPLIRQSIIMNLPLLNLVLDNNANHEKYQEWSKISAPTSKIPIYVVRTNEELMIAQETIKLMTSQNKKLNNLV
ncbi:acetate kinase [Entomoplasma freundtii]|uniref:Acetate kinase n=1 Tax=Entomoplasma freundtii TaxID=74700 RepID=A0A2K8NQY7_9MOLU|nr:acetate kinase [Entomoplasma freundtii]ATZ16229.1 acetate kinase [Entomoplasma freundtii]TDY56870.1 acetate kinase [Entomoplasma freundtii]